jgi:23S rRNA (uridine2552-2'-O)-methyltransferase
MKEHFDDHYVKMAQKEGYRSRACYKLLEIQEKDRLFKPGMSVVDLGCAPGGWSQVAAMLVGHNGQVLASDILEMDTLAGVEFIQGDFTDEEVFNELMVFLGNQKADLVISDMAPNMSGMKAVDQPKAMYLIELALELACQILKPEGVFVAKVFHGEGFDDFLRDTKRRFQQVVTRKPDASRSRSREVYLVARGLKVSD